MIRPTLRENLLEHADDIDGIVKQMLECLLEHDNKSGREEALSTLSGLFDSRHAKIKTLFNQIEAHQERTNLIQELEKCSEDRDTIIQNVEADLHTADALLKSTIFQANKKIRTMRNSVEQPVNTEQALQMAHQISKGFSVAGPMNWQQGDPSRPFPTEAEFRISQLMNPKPMGMPGAAPTLGMRQPPAAAGRGRAMMPQSPMSSSYGAQRGWSPRTGFVESPRTARNGIGGMSTPRAVGTSPFDSRRTSTGSEVRVAFTTPPMPSRAPPPVSNVGQMSSDSSSSSSSEDERRP
ncbi:unnamed protein product, partial [Mesorhabditis spiculigera]